MFHKLRYRIAAYFAALTVVVMALVLVVVNVLVSSHTNSVIALRFREASDLFEQQLNSETLWLSTFGQVVGSAPRLLAASATGDHQTVQDLVNTFRLQVKSELFTVIDETGHVLARVHDPERWGDDATGDPLIADALTGLSRTGLAIQDGKLYRIAAVPMVRGGQIISGVLKLGNEIDNEFAQTMKDLTGTDITFRVGQRVVASSLQERERFHLEKSIINGSSAKDPLPGDRDEPAEAFDISFDGERYRCATVELAPEGASYVIQRSIDREKEFLIKLHWLLVVVGLIALATVSVVSVLLARTIARPVSQLAELSAKVAGGDLDVRFIPGTRDEIGELAHSFNHMTGRLREYLAELENHRRNLERKVEERTAELASANRQLEIRNVRLSELSELSLASFENQDSLFKTITEHSRNLLGADIAVLGRHTDAGCQSLASSGTDPAMLERDDCMDRLNELYDTDPAKEILITEIDSTRESDYRSYVRTSIMVNDECWGTLCLLSRSDNAFSGQDVEVLGILRRILSTEIERAQWERQLLAYAAEVERANKAKSEFLANMSHELRTPLNVIVGFSELLETGVGGKLTGKQKRYIANINSSGGHLLALINDILDLSKVEAGILDFNIERFVISDVLANVESLIRGYAPKKQLDISFEIEDSLSTMLADQTRLKQILYNILSNAVKFTPEGGKVVLRASVLNDPGKIPQTSKLTAGAYLMVSVRDSGIGIPAGDHDKVWGEFRQVDSSYARKQEGTGLGMALTRKLVEMQGGQIWFESEQAKGSTFHFVLPLESVGQTQTFAGGRETAEVKDRYDGG